jgi:hypothetical protein
LTIFSEEHSNKEMQFFGLEKHAKNDNAKTAEPID